MTRNPAGLAATIALTATAGMAAAQGRAAPQRVIDVHVHAAGAGMLGRSPPIPTCTGDATFPSRDRGERWSFEQFATCDKPLLSARGDDELRQETIATLRKFNVLAVASGTRMDVLRQWRQAGEERVLPAIGGGSALNADSIRRWARDGEIRMLGELTLQYEGLAPNDTAYERLLSLAEELDLPVGVHLGPGAPGAPYAVSTRYRMRLSSALLFEDALVRHPKLRLCLMHAGWPLIDDVLAVLYAHPQVYVDVSLIDWYLPRAEFYSYLRRLIDAGFEKRILFGSDGVVWPQVIPIAIERIEKAPFLSSAQKRDIFYNNAARFLRLQ